MKKELWKISKVYFGLGGYQDACIGIFLTFTFDGTGVSTEKSAWDCNLIKHSDYCKWTEETRDKDYAEIMRFISGLLAKAKVDRVEKLHGIPVEATFDQMKLVDWRILEEVL